MNYIEFINRKSHHYEDSGFNPIFIPGEMKGFQKHLLEWAVKKGRALIAADCGLGKTFIELAWAQNVVQKTNKKVLILAPIAVTSQTKREGVKFGIDCELSRDGAIKSDIVIANYERLHLFNSKDFVAVVCDESSILKNYNGKRRSQITEFMREMPYRLLATATAAPNDYTELGTSSEALGYLGTVDMLGRFFKNDQANIALRRKYGEAPKWRFKGQAEAPFWRWVTSWARAIRMPSDLGFDNGAYVLPELSESVHVVKNTSPAEGQLFPLPAMRLDEQRYEIRRTLKERCEVAAQIVNKSNRPAFVGCHLNEEGKMLKSLIPDSIEINGSDSDDRKEEKFLSFLSGDARVLITKPKIGAWGLNFQHNSHIVYFPSHSYEQYYQFVRRSWRFGQERPVVVDIIMTESERAIMENLQNKQIKAVKMFENLVKEMNRSISINGYRAMPEKEVIPTWL
ncbi:MAG: DEAD/DEAH box helicase [bacterium]